MLRIALAALIALSTSLLAHAEPARPALKRAVTVNGEIVHIGDLIAHAGKHSDIAIFRAPDLGCTGSVPVSRVLAAVQPYGLTKVDTGGLSAIVVTRAGRPIAPEAIEDALRQALAGQQGLGTADDLTLQPDQALPKIYVEAAAVEGLEVARLTYNPTNRRFDALLYVPDSEVLRRAPLHVSGTAMETATAVVLTRAVHRGEVISSTDVTVERRPRAALHRDRVDRAGLAVGMAAQQSMSFGHVLRRSELMRPRLVRRNEMVTLVYEVPGILLTVRGKALDDGAEGDAVSVLNMQSKRTIAGTVTGPGRITVKGVLPMRPAKTASLR